MQRVEAAQEVKGTFGLVPFMGVSLVIHERKKLPNGPCSSLRALRFNSRDGGLPPSLANKILNAYCQIQ